MKIRTKFVSNSSSASFTIDKSQLSQEQIDKLLAYNNIGTMLLQFGDTWEIKDQPNIIKGFGEKDNDDIKDFFDELKIASHLIKWR